MKLTRLDKDPTGQSTNRRKANADLKRRLKSAMRDVISYIDSIPVDKRVINKSILVNKVSYEWLIAPDRLGGVDARIREIVDYWMQTQTVEKPARFFFDVYLDNSYSSGSASASANISAQATIGGISSAELSAIQMESILLSEDYRRAIEIVYSRAFNEMKGFSGDTATDLSRVLSDVIAVGQSPRSAQKQIRERFEVANGRAERIARTEINRANNIARTDTAQRTRNRLGLDVRVIHRSSLVETTRKWHAARHANVYTIAEQNQWWDEGTNRINCLCGTIEVVFDKKGNPMDSGVIQRMQEQKKIWFGAT